MAWLDKSTSCLQATSVLLDVWTIPGLLRASRLPASFGKHGNHLSSPSWRALFLNGNIQKSMETFLIGLCVADLAFHIILFPQSQFYGIRTHWLLTESSATQLDSSAGTYLSCISGEMLLNRYLNPLEFRFFFFKLLFQCD